MTLTKLGVNLTAMSFADPNTNTEEVLKFVFSRAITDVHYGSFSRDSGFITLDKVLS